MPERANYLLFIISPLVSLKKGEKNNAKNKIKTARDFVQYFSIH
jgi:hypothetical protein